MSRLHAPRTPWVMLAVFGVAALALFWVTAGRDFGLVGDTGAIKEIEAVSREVRMPIILDKYQTVKKELKEEISAELHHLHPEAPPPATATPVPATPTPDPVAPAPVAATAGGLPADDADAPGELLSHQFQFSDKDFEARFHTDRPVSGARRFFKSAPAVWVVDLPGRWTNRARRVNIIDQGAIAKVVIGEHDTYLRIVFRYRDSSQPRTAEPTVAEEEDGLRVVIPLSSHE